jgi:two-component system sensor histidine kinase PilS (NtrC family)
MVSLAAASLVGRGRLVLFYAAVATLGALLTQIYGVVGGQFDTATLVQAGVLSSGFFATAILARLLGQRIMLNEELARQRGVELENQGLISQRIVERMQDGILVVSRSGQVMRQNPVATMMLDLPACEFCLLADRAPPLAAALNAWALAGGEDHCELSAPGGQELRARFERTQSSDGEILIFLQDLGQVRAQAQQLKLASLGRLTASIAHEVRNPLSAIGHAGELLREERRGEMQDRLLRILNDNVSRLDRIVSDILELGRQGQANPEPLALGEFCAGFIDHLLATESVQPGVLVLEADAACVLMFDRAHLHQIMWNLVGNALRHASGHVGAVRVRVQPSALEGRVELHLIDDGPGIPANLREQVFEPFFTTHTKGTGLGLFIARELCGANGATLELGPEGGGGHFIVVGRSET